MVVVGGGIPRQNLGCRWYKNQNSWLKLEEVPKPVNILINQWMTSNHHWDIFTFYGMILHFEILKETWRKFPCGSIHVKILRDSVGKGGEILHMQNSPLLFLNFRREIMRKFPQGRSAGIPNVYTWKFGGLRWLARWAVRCAQKQCDGPKPFKNDKR